MKASIFKFFLTAFSIAALMGFPVLLQQADARGGGFRGGGGGGFSGGSFRGGGGYASGPRGGAVAEGPRGGVAVEGPRGGVAAEGPSGAGVARGPEGGAAVRGPGGYGAAVGPEGGVAVRGPEGSYAQGAYGATTVTVNRGWDAYYGAGAVAVGAVAAGLAIGTAVGSVPSYATGVTVGGDDYYVADGVYYQTCLNGADVYYCVVEPPH